MRYTLVLLLSLCLVPFQLTAQQVTRSGLKPPKGPKPAFRQFPCGGETILDEDFQTSGDTLPAGWSSLDLDQFTPRDEILFLTPAKGWQKVVDFRDPDSINLVMASPSWYKDTTGASNDYLISPKISLTANPCLSWYAYSQDPGFGENYEVLVSNTTPDSAGFAANAPVLVVTGEGDEFTYRSVSLAAYSEQEVYVAFRQTSSDKFILVLDDIRVAEVESFDLAMFTLDPIEADTTGDEVTFSGSFINRGLQEVSFDSAQFQISYQVNDSPVETITIDSAFTLVPNDTMQFVHDSTWTVDSLGSLRIAVWISGFGVDDIPANDSLIFFQAVGVPTSIGQALDVQKLRLYPNPTATSVQWEPLRPDQYPVELYLRDLRGRAIIQQSLLRPEAHQLDLSQLPGGLYFLQLIGPKGQQWMGKIQKQ